MPSLPTLPTADGSEPLHADVPYGSMWGSDDSAPPLGE